MYTCLMNPVMQLGILTWQPISLFFLCWLAYFDVQQGQWVSDDWDGIAHYDGKLKRTQVPKAATPGASVIAKGASLWSDTLTWIRWQIGKTTNPQHGKPTDPKDPLSPRINQPYIASSRAHHRINIWLLCGAALLLYNFLTYITTPDIAYYATVLWIIHPVGAQCVGWISGIGYCMASFFMFAGLGYAGLLHDVPMSWQWGPILLGYALLQGLAVRSQFTSLAAAVVLSWLGWWQFATVAWLIALAGATQVILQIFSVRAATFKEQQMSQSTKLYPRKLVVVFKTLAYYTLLVFFPKRLGLYHTFGYHYPLPQIEWEDKWFWGGVATTGALLLVACLGGPVAAFAVLWYVAYLSFVLNAVTAHQFIGERYTWIPSVGMCLLVAMWTPSWLLWVLIGILLMRTWAHLPTYYNELYFYLSNCWNFPNSEVALGNLGVTYLRLGKPGTAIDTFTQCAQVNPDYDVAWYNMYSFFRGQGLYDQARAHLVRALSSPLCHFPKQWGDELQTLDFEIQWRDALAKVPKEAQLEWQHTNLTRMLAEPTLAHRGFWEGKLKKLPPLPPIVAGSIPIVEATTT